MIQRIQTIWLFLATLVILLLLLIPTVTKQANGTEYWIVATGLYQKNAQGITKLQDFLSLIICTIATAIISLANIFNYTNRKLQKRIALINVMFIVALSFWIFQAAKKIPGGLDNASYNLGAFFPLLAIIFVGLALRGINQDEKLVRSADRLR
jgi:glucan phosphoethanolaminetransferase (alkaline phosphatase superfamily)